MKVMLINGSPREGCTLTALQEVAKPLEEGGVETEIISIGTQAVRGCIACEKCKKTGRCVFDDLVNQILDKVEHTDGFVFGTPVYYASANGSMVSLMDRLFYAGSRHFRYKPGAVVAAARRAGTIAAYDVLNKYLGISQMIMVPSMYWNMVFGHNRDEASQDPEGLQIMRGIGSNMLWLLQLLESGRQNGISLPPSEPRLRTNFIR